MTRSAQGFRKDTRGNVAILVAVSLMVLVSIVLGSLEIASNYTVRYRLQAALDAAALAAAKEEINRSSSIASIQLQLAAAAQKVLDANLNISPSAATVTPVQVKYTPPVGLTIPDKIEVSVGATMNNSFLKALGMKAMAVTLSSTSVPPQGAPVELVLVLDVTFSMNAAPSTGGAKKIDTLKAAATKLVNKVMGGGNPNVKVGIVPYNTYINIGVQNPIPSWYMPIDRDLGTCVKWSDYPYPNGLCKPPVFYDCKVDGVWTTNGCSTQDCSDKGVRTCLESGIVRLPGNTGCIGLRSILGTNNPANLGANTTSETYLDNLKDPEVVKYPSSYNGCYAPKILDLTTNSATVLSAINALVASTDTNIPNGLIWGWNMLTPEAPLTTASTDAALKAIGGRKVIVLMTDGANSTSPRLYDATIFPNGAGNNPPPWQDGTKSVALIKKICDNIKAAGNIDIYTVMFDVQGGDSFTDTTRANLRGCPQDPTTMYFNANDNNALLQAFDDIGNQLRLLKLTQ